MAQRPNREGAAQGSAAWWIARAKLKLRRPQGAPALTAKIYIDGQAGTTGLEIAGRLRGRRDLRLLSIDDAERKDPAARARLFKEADIAVLCLPDEAAREAVALAEGRCRLLDASSAHRTAAGWVYGLPELCAAQAEAIAAAERVSNPGCYPQGFILSVRPLVEAGLLPADALLSLHAVSGYSGGGRRMIEAYQAAAPEQLDRWGARPYALELRHKHLPEMHLHSGLREPPIFCPIVGNFHKGMITQTPLFAAQLNNGAGLRQAQDALAQAYAQAPFIDVAPCADGSRLDAGYLSPCACNGSNRLEIMLFGNADRFILAARYDNLGKGAAGAAVQNLNLMLGRAETEGLT